MTRFLFVIIALGLLAGCALPKTILQNPETRQVVVCGGGQSNLWMLGRIAYLTEKSNIVECETDYLALGFKTIRKSPD